MSRFSGRLGRHTAACVLAVVVCACSSDEPNACDRIVERLDAIDDELAGLGEQSWENVVRNHELHSQHLEARRDLAAEGCDQPPP
jgi:hypothetical protein